MADAAAAGTEEVKLLGTWACPFALRTKIALNLKSVDYQMLEEINFPEKSELLLELNPVFKTIPVLIHHGQPICESMVTVQYVDDVWGDATAAPILPADPYDRALHRFWAAFVDAKLAPLHSSAARSESEAARAETVKKLMAGLELLEGAFEGLSKGKGFFGGGDIGYLDIALGCFLGWFGVISEMYGVELFDGARTPMLAAWAERFRAHEAVKRVLPEVGRLLELVKKVQDDKSKAEK